MVQTDAAGMTRGGGGVGVWIFRVLLLAGAAFMIYSWFSIWWSADIAIIPGANDMVLHPWGIEAVAQVKANSDVSAFEMPWFFAPFMWVYFAVTMILIAVSLFWTKRIKIGRFNIPLAVIFVLLVGLSYMAALGIAYEIGTLRAGWAGAKFLGKSNVRQPGSGAEIKMVSQLEIGYWLAIASGGVLTVLALVRPLFVRGPKVAKV